MITALIGVLILFLAGSVAGLLPVVSTKLIVRLYPPGDPRRAELVAELFAVPHHERPLWVGQTLGLALTEGLSARWLRAGRFSSASIRAIDLVLASAVLVLLAPTLLMTAIAIRCSSRGPVVFRQARVGKDGRLFEVLAFRTTLVLDRGQTSGPLFTMTDDPRVTPVGRWLRRTSLDKLPHLWNVVRGEMSFVGPPPARLGETLADLEVGERLRVKPGMTDVRQGSASLAASVEMDPPNVRRQTVRQYISALVRIPFAMVRIDRNR